MKSITHKGNWGQTVASKCRYSRIAERIWGSADIIWEDSICDYQGEVNILARMPDGRFSHYAYSYGSCSGCDKWESAEYTDDQIEEEMRDTSIWFDDMQTLANYLHLQSDKEHILSNHFTSMRKAFIKWAGDNLQ